MTKHFRLLIPLLGIIVFVMLYIIAACLYPGGSHEYPHAMGFSIVYNYWCDLQNEIALNGMPNPARPVAIAAFTELCVTMLFLCMYIPLLFDTVSRNHKVIKYSGMACCVTGVFLFTDYHDAVINIASFFAVIAFSLTFYELYKHKEYKLILSGVFSFLWGIMNYIMFIEKAGLTILPTLQKFMFLFYLLWVGWVDVCIYRRVRQKNISSI